MISARGLTKSFGDLVAVNNVSFTIRKGEITGILGPNGAGKTTTLRMLTCYLNPDAGDIEIGDYNVREHPLEVKKTIGYLPESAPLYPDMLVYDYLSYVSEVHGVTAEARIAEMGKLCGITEVMHKNISELSKGYKQRVGLAHAMIHDPEILILDEPTSGLDPNQIVEIRNLIREIGKKKTVILSTHILPEVEATCDRVIIIDRGSIVADDRTEILQKAHGKERRITVKISGADYAALSGALKDLQGVRDVFQVQDEHLTAAVVVVDGESEIRPGIFTMAGEKGWVLYEMKQEQMSLEHIFRQLTQGGSHGQI
ncbi:MAG TPA: ATP-binding cassette domain-containing protein [Spirochaetota bacterium]|nr:ATP-binding cassette domain-containing protein [Spirochaetota bacterium]HPI91299.1 ATP-binding cassette domain-containing protein [Spirochaetota bacterium]HPR48191.1 ATP-binding cassette domain-containing protein [Spirochaetota bacterium]